MAEMSKTALKTLKSAVAKRNAERKKGTFTGFKALTKKLMAKGKSEGLAKGIAVKVGRKKFGKAGFQALAALGKRKAAARRKRG